jgi:hypothetical protein
MLSKQLSILGIFCIVFLSLSAIGQATNRTVVVNIMIDAELRPSAKNLTPQVEVFVELNSLVEMLEISQVILPRSKLGMFLIRIISSAWHLSQIAKLLCMA